MGRVDLDHRALPPWPQTVLRGGECQARAGRAQRNHVALALRAFVRLETYCFHAGLSWFEARARIVHDAIRHYLARPLYNLSSTA